MRNFLASSIVAVISIATIGSADAQTAACKGREQQACTADPVCRWLPERKAGETVKKDGTPHKVSAKAHCRSVPQPKTAKAE